MSAVHLKQNPGQAARRRSDLPPDDDEQIPAVTSPARSIPSKRSSTRETLCHRRQSHRGAWLQHGRGVGLEFRGALSGPVGGRGAGGRFFGNATVLTRLSKGKIGPTWYEMKLWHVYDCTDYALNLFNCPTVAYSGEKDNQKQAADMMEKAAAAEGIKLVHVIGAGAGHNYTAAAKVEINHRLDSIVAAGRDPLPQEIHFTTWTLRYNHMRWLTIDTMEKHWERARIDTERTPNGAILKTLNVTGLTLSMPPGSPLKNNQPTNVIIDGQELKGSPVLSDRSWTSRFQKKDGKWQLAAQTPVKSDVAWQKTHGLQGPIDDAFMDRFIFVRPTGSPLNAKVDAWVKWEMDHAIDHWRKQFRGEVVQKDDTAVTADDEKTANLILWGDPSSNKYLAKIGDKLPIG